MPLSLGIVGLPNVGKSTLFNTLTESAAAQASNYPFTTIEPNVGVVPVPDATLPELARVASSAKVVQATVEFVDIAGLVAGASKGEGLGNAFLSNIREVDALCHVVRHFTDKDVIHVAGKVDPKDDISTIETELCLADIVTVARRMHDLDGKARTGDADAKRILDIVVRAHAALEDGKPVRSVGFHPEEAALLHDLHLLTLKPVLVVANVDETAVGGFDDVAAAAALGVPEVVAISAKVESELVGMPPDDRAAFLKEYGLTTSGLERLIRRGFELLGLQTFYTAGEKEARAWTIHAGWTAPQAAGVIHSDFEKHFIRADVVAAADFIAAGGWLRSKENGKVRSEGRAYIMRPDDVVLFHTSA